MPHAIDPCQVPVVILYNQDDAWTASEQAEVDAMASQLGEAVARLGHPTTLVRLSDADLLAALRPFDPDTHIVFNWCESLPGIPKSEPMVARLLESAGFTFTGAGSIALERSLDRAYMQRVLEREGIPTPAWQVFDHPDTDGWSLFPAIVKAVHEHCSEGITRDSVVMNPAEMKARIAFVLDTYRQSALVEDFIDGREFHVSLWGNGEVEMLPPAEMDFSRFGDVHDRLCTHDSKFVPGSTAYQGIETLLPAPLEPQQNEQLKAVCLAAYQALGCRDYGRMDVRLRNGEFLVLDVNPNADISSDASLACAAELAGFSYGDVGSRIIRLAARRHGRWKIR